MIDVESQIYTPIAEALRAQFPGILVSGEYVNAPTRFPYVSLVEQDNYTTEAHMDSGDTERFATLMYEGNVYSDKAGGKKSVCRNHEVCGRSHVRQEFPAYFSVPGSQFGERNNLPSGRPIQG